MSCRWRRREPLQHSGRRQRRTVDFDDRDVDLAARIASLTPDAPTVLVQHHGEHARAREVLRIGMELDLDAVREVLARFVDQHVPSGHEEQAAVAIEEESACGCQGSFAVEGGDSGGGQQQWFDHAGLKSVRGRGGAAPVPAGFVSQKRLLGDSVYHDRRRCGRQRW